MVTSKEVAIREVTTEVEDGSNSDWISEGNGTFRFLTEDERSPPDRDSLLSDSVVDTVDGAVVLVVNFERSVVVVPVVVELVDIVGVDVALVVVVVLLVVVVVVVVVAVFGVDSVVVVLFFVVEVVGVGLTELVRPFCGLSSPQGEMNSPLVSDEYVGLLLIAFN